MPISALEEKQIPGMGGAEMTCARWRKGLHEEVTFELKTVEDPWQEAEGLQQKTEELRAYGKHPAQPGLYERRSETLVLYPDLKMMRQL